METKSKNKKYNYDLFQNFCNENNICLHKTYDENIF